MGFDWPFSPLWLGLGAALFVVALVYHGLRRPAATRSWLRGETEVLGRPQ